MHSLLPGVIAVVVLIGIIAVATSLPKLDNSVSNLRLAIVTADHLILEDSFSQGIHAPSGVRLFARQLTDGKIVARVEGVSLIGDAPDFLWCSSKKMVVHARTAATLLVVHDEAAVTADGKGLVLVKETKGKEPVFDTHSRGVFAFGQDGKSVLISPSLSIKKRSAENCEFAYNDVPKTAGAIRISNHVGGTLPTATAHHDTLTFAEGEGGKTWDSTLPTGWVSHVQYLFATPRHVVIIVNLYSGSKPLWVTALDRTTGIEAWRANL